MTLRERTAPETVDGEPVGPPDGVVGSGDPTTDERVCSNEQCATHRGAADAPRP